MPTVRGALYGAMQATVVAALTLTALVGGLLAGSTARPASADEAGPAPSSIGGQLLGSRGVVEHGLAGAPALPHGVSARAWLVADLDTGDVLAARDAHGQFLPASTLKVLTALTLIPRLDPKAVVRITNDDVNVDGSRVGVVPGEGYTVEQLFTALLVVSGNDAAGALARAAGGRDTTVRMMNEVAHWLRAGDTVARTPSGLDAPGQHTSAYDLALIGRAALTVPDFRRYVTTVRSYMPAPGHQKFEIYTHDRLLTHYPGAIGVKNGYTSAAQATYIGAARRGGHTLMVTLMDAHPAFWKEAEALLDWGFAARGRVVAVGRLVQPLAGSSPAANGRGAVHGATASRSVRSARDAVVASVATVAARRDNLSTGGGRGPALPAALLAVSAVGATLVRRRHLRRRRRLRLPPDPRR
jgi:D-alanyl-D-alanine carboxypeptidase (penicillin-binding protein 5/6)